MSKRSRIVGYGSAAALVLAGALGATAFSGTFGQALALVLMGLGLVLAVSLVFYEVGLSEDREREATRRREEARERKAAKRRARSDQAQDGRPRPRLERMRGRPRRLK